MRGDPLQEGFLRDQHFLHSLPAPVTATRSPEVKPTWKGKNRSAKRQLWFYCLSSLCFFSPRFRPFTAREEAGGLLGLRERRSDLTSAVPGANLLTLCRPFTLPKIFLVADERESPFHLHPPPAPFQGPPQPRGKDHRKPCRLCLGRARGAVLSPAPPTFPCGVQPTWHQARHLRVQVTIRARLQGNY